MRHACFSLYDYITGSNTDNMTCEYDHMTGTCRCTETVSPTAVLEGITGNTYT